MKREWAVTSDTQKSLIWEGESDLSLSHYEMNSPQPPEGDGWRLVCCSTYHPGHEVCWYWEREVEA